MGWTYRLRHPIPCVGVRQRKNHYRAVYSMKLSKEQKQLQASIFRIRKEISDSNARLGILLEKCSCLGHNTHSIYDNVKNEVIICEVCKQKWY